MFLSINTIAAAFYHDASLKVIVCAARRAFGLAVVLFLSIQESRLFSLDMLHLVEQQQQQQQPKDSSSLEPTTRRSRHYACNNYTCYHQNIPFHGLVR